MHQVRPQTLRISSNDWPESERVPMWREVIGRLLFRLDIEPLPDMPFHADYTVHTLGGLSVLSSFGSGWRQWRTQDLIPDGNSDLVLIINTVGRLILSQRGEELELGEREAALLSAADVGGYTRPHSGHIHTLRMPRVTIAALSPRADDAVMRRIPRSSPMLQLLTGYVGLLEQNHALIDPKTASLIVEQIYDLVAATITAAGECIELSNGHSVRQARLATIRADILANLAQVGLSPKTVARRHGVSDRYVHLLFEETGQTFTRFVEEERLKRAFALLTDPACTDVRIGAIAARLGFSEHSAFNRAFRRYFGDTPRNVRRNGLKV
jgi:AraC-like DNA-binding protein